jgi:hypothetical protein
MKQQKLFFRKSMRGLPSCKLQDLVKYIIQTQYYAYDAASGAKTLQQLVTS